MVQVANVHIMIGGNKTKFGRKGLYRREYQDAIPKYTDAINLLSKAG